MWIRKQRRGTFFPPHMCCIEHYMYNFIAVRKVLDKMNESLTSGPLLNGTEQLSLDEGGAIGILEHLQKDELQSLLDDDNKLEQLIQDSEVVRTEILISIIRFFSTFSTTEHISKVSVMILNDSECCRKFVTC